MKITRKLLTLLLALLMLLSLLPAAALAAKTVSGSWYCPSGPANIKSVRINGQPFSGSVVLESGSTADLTVEADNYLQAYDFYFFEPGLSEKYTLSGSGSITTCSFTVPDRDFTICLNVGSLGYVVEYWDGNPYQTICYDYDTTIIIKAPSELTPPRERPGYVFLGWGETQTGTEVVYQPGDTIKAENRYRKNKKSLFARWKKADAHTISVENGTAASSEAAAGETVTISADTRENFTFHHWEVVSGGVTVKEPNSAATSFVMGEADVVLKAVYRYTAPELTEFHVRMTPPAAGALPEAPTVDSELYKVSAYNWVGVKDDVAFRMHEGDRFEAGVFYQCHANLVLTGRQVGDEEKLVGYVNGETAPGGMDVIVSRQSFEKVKIVGSFVCAETGEKLNPFVDVKESDLFYKSVLWAYYHDPQITKGMDDTHFGPERTVTRGQAVTFLWRAEGCPQPSNTASAAIFTDLTADWYREAVAWAVENGVTKGVDDTHFDPEGTLTTAHIVTFLYRAENPGKNGWYEEARDWAEYHEILYGIPLVVDNTTFCPRSAVVMLLGNLFARE